MHFTRMFTLVALVAFASSSVFAQETSTEAKKCTKCPASTTSLTANQQAEGDCQECPVMTAALAKLPKMTFQVGDEATCCDKSAATLAKKKSLPVQFVVAKKSFKDKTAAYTALVDETESFVNTFVTPHKCETSGTTSVAGHSCDCPVSSAKFAEQVKAAVDAVAISYKVGDESCNCPNQAAEMAKAKGTEVNFVVGEETTSCELTARMNLATAKYKAAVAAINKATSTTKEEATEEKSGS